MLRFSPPGWSVVSGGGPRPGLRCCSRWCARRRKGRRTPGAAGGGCMDQPRVVVRRRDAVEPAGGGTGLVRIGRHRAAVQRRGETSGQVAHGVVGGHERWHAAIDAIEHGVAGGSGEAAHARECQRSVGADPADERAPSRLCVDPQVGGRLFLPGLRDVGVEVTVQRPRPAGVERGQVGAQHPQHGLVARDDQLPPSVAVPRSAHKARGNGGVRVVGVGRSRTAGRCRRRG